MNIICSKLVLMLLPLFHLYGVFWRLLSSVFDLWQGRRVALGLMFSLPYIYILCCCCFTTVLGRYVVVYVIIEINNKTYCRTCRGVVKCYIFYIRRCAARVASRYSCKIRGCTLV